MMIDDVHVKVSAVTLLTSIVVLGACTTKPKPLPDAGVIAVAPPVDATILIEPPVEDAAVADVGPAGKKSPAPENPTVRKLKACCDALKNEGQRNATSPEGQALMTLATTCRGLATQVGPAGTAPELAPFRAALAGRKLPVDCHGI
jgi:hypothetical protein